MLRIMTPLYTPAAAVRTLQKFGLNQSQIAALAKTTQATICRIVSGQKGVDYRIVDALRIAVARFQKREDRE